MRKTFIIPTSIALVALAVATFSVVLISSPFAHAIGNPVGSEHDLFLTLAD